MDFLLDDDNEVKIIKDAILQSQYYAASAVNERQLMRNGSIWIGMLTRRVIWQMHLPNYL